MHRTLPGGCGPAPQPERALCIAHQFGDVGELGEPFGGGGRDVEAVLAVGVHVLCLPHGRGGCSSRTIRGVHYVIEATVLAGQGPDAADELLAMNMALPDAGDMGITSRTVFVSLDGRTSYLIVETDQPASILERFMSLSPWVEARIVPVIPSEEALGAMLSAIERIRDIAD